MKHIKVCEIFKSIQGEGIELGIPTVFLRLSGCNLSCEFCDTCYHKEGEYMSIPTLLAILKSYGRKHVTITGGEPLLQEDAIKQIIKDLKKLNYIISLETNCTIPTELGFDTIVVSPKKQAITDKVVENIITYNSYSNTYFKFVYQNKNDLWWEKLIEDLKIKQSKIIIMSEAKTKVEHESIMDEVVNYCIKNDFRFTPRLQVLCFGGKRGR